MTRAFLRMHTPILKHTYYSHFCSYFSLVNFVSTAPDVKIHETGRWRLFILYLLLLLIFFVFFYRYSLFPVQWFIIGYGTRSVHTGNDVGHGRRRQTVFAAFFDTGPPLPEDDIARAFNLPILFNKNCQRRETATDSLINNIFNFFKSYRSLFRGAKRFSTATPMWKCRKPQICFFQNNYRRAYHEQRSAYNIIMFNGFSISIILCEDTSNVIFPSAFNSSIGNPIFQCSIFSERFESRWCIRGGGRFIYQPHTGKP